MTAPAPPRLRCRPIVEADLAALAGLLTEGFPERGARYWEGALERLRTRAAPDGYPRYGYALEHEGAPVGVLLLIFSAVEGGAAVRCNVSSWYVRPAFRAQATLLTSAAKALKGVTYVNTSPAAHTWPIIEAQGYIRYADGQMLCVPALSRGGRGMRVTPYSPEVHDAALSASERELLAAHAALGCLALVVSDSEASHPFVLMPRRIKHLPLPTAQLVWCRDTAEFVACAAAVGRWLLWRRGVALALCDANGPVAGLVGRFFAGRQPRYFRGPHGPRLNDLAYTEATLFGA